MTDAFAGLILGLLLSAAAADEKIVCVPNAEGGWDCGKGALAPEPRPLPPSAAPAREAAPPPIYLMDPERMPSVVRESVERGDMRGAQEASRHLPPVEPTTAEPARTEVAETVAAPEPEHVPEPVAPPVVPMEPTPVEPEPTPEAAPVAEPEPTPEPEPVAPPEPTPEPAATAMPEPPPEPEAVVEPMPTPQPVASSEAPEAPRVQRSISSVARDAAELLALAPDAYTVQLAAARNIQGFAAFRMQYEIAVEDTFVIQVKRGEETWWLMLWRDFPNLASARAAIAALPNSPTGIWPRRLAPLQAEVRATSM